MQRLSRKFTVTAIASFLVAGAVLAQDRQQTRDQDRVQTPAQDQTRMNDPDIYGSQLMTAQERNDYRERMRAAKTAQEREQIRAEHHARMQARAKERGLTMPDQPRSGARGPAARGGYGGRR